MSFIFKFHWGWTAPTARNGSPSGPASSLPNLGSPQMPLNRWKVWKFVLSNTFPLLSDTFLYGKLSPRPENPTNLGQLPNARKCSGYWWTHIRVRLPAWATENRLGKLIWYGKNLHLSSYLEIRSERTVIAKFGRVGAIIIISFIVEAFSGKVGSSATKINDFDPALPQNPREHARPRDIFH